tara:strand:- start:645 stop:1022 length:378 start_codon:yes stop_codon:yes gene_type:complete
MAKVLKKFHTKEMANIEKEWEIPTALWNAAKAILIIKKGKVGAGVSVECGTGVMIRRLDGDKWSAPSCVSLAGAGIGWQVGVSMTHIVMVMLSDSGGTVPQSQFRLASCLEHTLFDSIDLRYSNS